MAAETELSDNPANYVWNRVPLQQEQLKFLTRIIMSHHTVSLDSLGSSH